MHGEVHTAPCSLQISSGWELQMSWWGHHRRNKTDHRGLLCLVGVCFPLTALLSLCADALNPHLLQRTEWFPISRLCHLSSCSLPCLKSPASIAAGVRCAAARSRFGCIAPLQNSQEVTPLPYLVSSTWFCLWCSPGSSKGPVMMMGSLLDVFLKKYSLHHYL